MNDTISSKSVIHKNAVIGKNVCIMPFAVIDENVKIGDNTVIGPGTHITGWTDIGKDNKIHAGTVIGDEPQDLNYKNERSYVIIGDNNIFREFVTVHRGTAKDSKTIIGNNNMFMTCSHAGHNTVVKDRVILVNCTALGGYVEVDSFSFLSYCVSIHQFTKVGKYAMIAPNSKAGKDVPPYMLVSGSDTAEVRGLNVVGLRRANISSENREIIKQAYKILYHSKLNRLQAIEKISADKELSANSYIIELLDFIKNSERGICGHYRK